MTFSSIKDNSPVLYSAATPFFPMSGISADHLTRQVVILHLSDLHFGEKHRFSAAEDALG
jgi:hypothetical protein